MIAVLKSLFLRTKNRQQKGRPWADAQEYEFENARLYMESEQFKGVLEMMNSGDKAISRGYVDPLVLKEFFSDDMACWNVFVQHIRNKTVLEIGPCLATQLSLWDVAKNRVVIEPLLTKIQNYQMARFGMTGFPGVVGHACPAEERVESLVGSVDGAVFIRNCIDHSPQWPFILSNIADYLVSGGYLLLWTDLAHPPGFEDGHYDITSNIESFRHLLRNMGFDVLSEYQNLESPCLNYGCRAIKR